jgi:toxin-antitoxin system PIN domain toxin
VNVLVDTNILLYAVNPASPEHRAARAEVERLRTGESPWFLTWGIVYEFLRVATHSAVFERPLAVPSAVLFIKRLMESPSLRVLQETDKHLSLLEEEIKEMPGVSGNDLHDMHMAVLMREHNLRTILTADKGFRRFKNLRVIDLVHG